MKYCYQCGRMTAGDPLFCNTCGRSYNVKLCPRLHPNPRSAEVCSQCGNRELSQPQPRASFWSRVVACLVIGSAGLVLAYLFVAVLLELLRELLAKPEIQGGILGLAILLGLLAWLWSELPDWFRKLVRRLLKRKERSRER